MKRELKALYFSAKAEKFWSKWKMPKSKKRECWEAFPFCFLSLIHLKAVPQITFGYRCSQLDCLLYTSIHRLGQPEELLPLMRPYFIVLLISLLFVLLFNGFQQFADGITDTRVSLWIFLTGNVMNIIGTYILIYGKLGICLLYTSTPVSMISPASTLS